MSSQNNFRLYNFRQPRSPGLFSGGELATHLVQLDALIRREDFEDGGEALLGQDPSFKLEELQRGKLYYSVLRKPEFQRETANWSPEMIVDFVESYLDSKMIPSIIIWHSRATNKIFVIDGAHRVSALIAWANDDYGDGQISRDFFGGDISPQQKRFHERTKQLIEERIGTFQSLHTAALQADRVGIHQNETNIRRGRVLTFNNLHIQKVDGDARVAEESFFKINANPATIDPTELDVIKARAKPNAIATRAIIRAGTGILYGGKLPRIEEIKSLAREVYDLIFGQIIEISSKSADVPRGGQPYSSDAFRMILDMVNLFNDVTPGMWQHKDKPRRRASTVQVLEDDTDGSATIAFLEKLKSVGRLVADNSYAASLGLDQAVYSYGETGRFHSVAFLASLKFALNLKEGGNVQEFKRV